MQTRRLTSWPAAKPGQFERFVLSSGAPRRYVLHIPGGYNSKVQTPLWLAFPGTADSPEDMINQSGMTDYAGKRTIILAALQGEDLSFNVEAGARALPGRADDVSYTTDVLRDVTKEFHIDWNRIHCLGFSRGARMCSRLASELSSVWAAIAPVSGLRFPVPNNASRPIPIISFHGTKDMINPFWGHGSPYWTESMPDVIHQWVIHNQCKKFKRQKISHNVELYKHEDCAHGGDVFLTQVDGGGHTWPGSERPTALGYVSHGLSATVDIGNFFQSHPLFKTCWTVTKQSRCHWEVQWARQHGIFDHPEWYSGLSYNSSFEQFQEHLHWNFLGDCPLPCPASTTTTTAATRKSTTKTTLRKQLLDWGVSFPNLAEELTGAQSGGLQKGPRRNYLASSPTFVVGACVITGSLMVAAVVLQQARRWLPPRNRPQPQVIGDGFLPIASNHDETVNNYDGPCTLGNSGNYRNAAQE